MKLVQIQISNFRSFGPAVTAINLVDMTFFLGPNGAGKTAVLQALSRMFGLDPSQRRIQPSDFHVPTVMAAAAPVAPTAPVALAASAVPAAPVVPVAPVAPEAPAAPAIPAARELWIEADFEFPELAENQGAEADFAAIPVGFAHLRLVNARGPAVVRFRLSAVLDQDGEIDETFTCVIQTDDNDDPLEETTVSKQDRNSIQVHYLPARRNPSDHVSYSANAMLGRLLRAANWTAEREQIKRLTEEISAALVENAALEGLAESLGEKWGELHRGAYFADPVVSFARRDIENLLKHLSIGFTPGHGQPLVDFSLLSDGQQSLLYISLVLAVHDIGRKVLNREIENAFDIYKLRPAAYTLIAIEEPENSLSPHYLGRVIKSLKTFSDGSGCQAVVATHSPSLLRRVDPKAIRYLRLDSGRRTVVKTVVLPADESAAKFVREGVQAFPELYFSRLVVLGEGDSEEVVLPRLLAARGILTDDASISVAPLGGRHVNHFWRLLNGLGIPHITLLDLDLARYQGGWGRIKYAAGQLLQYTDISPELLTQQIVDGITRWDDLNFFQNGLDWISCLENRGVFFSSPLDLDFMMLTAYPDAYGVDATTLAVPDAATVKLVLGKSHSPVANQYSAAQLQYFDYYLDNFKRNSKPASHINGMSRLTDEQLNTHLPPVLGRFFTKIEAMLDGLPE